MPKFMFIDALSYLTEKNHDKFKETIKDMLQRYPQTDITPVASEIVKQLNQGRRLEGGGSNVRGMLWTTRLSNDTTPEALERTFTPFAEDNDKPQVFILLYPTDSINGNMLLYEVARHNFNTFKVKDYDIEQMNFGELGLLVIKGLDNFKEATHYRTAFEQDQSITIPRQVHYVIISVDNFNLLLNEGRTFEDYFNYLEEKNDKEHSDLEKKELDEEQKKAQEEADALAAQEREKARLEAEQMEREAAELAKRDAEEKAKEEAEEKARLEAEAAEKARLEAEEKARQESERKQIQASDYRSKTTTGGTTNLQNLSEKELKAQERAEEEHLKQLEREAKAREKAERKRQKEIEDSIKKEQKYQRKLARMEEIAEQDSIEQAEKEKEKERDFYYKWREDSAKAAFKAAEQAKKDAKKAKEQARKDKAKERKELAKQREKERKEKAKERERERKAKQKERKEQAKAREQERKQRQKEREQERKEKAEQRKQQAKDREEERKNQSRGAGKKNNNDNGSGNDNGTDKKPTP